MPRKKPKQYDHYNQLVPPEVIRLGIFGNAYCTLLDGRDLGSTYEDMHPVWINDNGYWCIGVPESINAVIPFTVYTPAAHFVTFAPGPGEIPLTYRRWIKHDYYEPLEIVDSEHGMFIAQTYVPPDTDITNRNYWKPWRYTLDVR